MEKFLNGNAVFLQDLILTLLLGGLVGLEREQNGKNTDVHEFGIRTMALVSMLGYLAYYLFVDDLQVFTLITGGVVLMILSAYFVSVRVHKTTGITTEFAALFVYLVGVLMGMGETLIAALIALIVLLLLYFKEPLHGFAYKVDKEEIYSTFKFIAVVFVVLPLLPNQTFGPLNVLNPYLIWLMVIFVASISFVSYIAIKLMGPKKGIGFGGFLGGLISSTAVSVSFSQMSKGRASKRLVNPLVFGILIASSAMFFRILLELTVLNHDLMAYLSMPMLAMGGSGLLLSLYFWFGRGNQDVSKKKISEDDLNLKSPFQLWPAIQFAIFFAALLFVSKFTSEYFGNHGLYVTALFSGLADVDAITISMANLTASQDVSLIAGATTVTIAAMTNTLVKGGIALLFASRQLALRIMLSVVTIVCIGALSLLVFLPDFYGIA